MKSCLVLLTFATILGFKCVNGWAFNLDVDKDAFMSWRITGPYLYIPVGDEVEKMFHDNLPQDFDFKAFKGVRGLWAILPEMDNTLEAARASSAHANTSVSFACSASAQLFSNVKLTYISRGDALIYLMDGSNKKPIFTIYPSSTAQDELVAIEIPIKSPSSRFSIQANVTGTKPDSFIFIDKIIATVSEASTTPRTTTTPSTRTTTSKTKPTAVPVVSSAHQPSQAFFKRDSLYSLIFLILSIEHIMLLF